MTPHGGPERRRSPRFELLTPLDRVEYESRARSGTGRITDLSVHGVRIEDTSEVLEVGDVVVMRLAVMRGDGPVVIRGRVVRRDGAKAIAVDFDTGLDDDTQQILGLMISAMCVG